MSTKLFGLNSKIEVGGEWRQSLLEEVLSKFLLWFPRAPDFVTLG